MRSGGVSLLEVVLVVALIGLTLMVALPALADLGSTVRLSAAARQIAMQFHALRWKSVTLGTNCGLLFERDARGWYWREIRDGNGNGLRTAEVRDGTDPVVSGPHRLEEMISHVTLGFPSRGPYPAIPPRGGQIPNLNDPIQFGRSDLVAFAPLGTASSGTVYLSDGRQELFGVVLFGPTARVRVWRYQSRSRRWTL